MPNPLARSVLRLLPAAVLAAGCATAPPPASPSPPAPSAPAAPVCEGGTLGLEAGALSRGVRKRLALPADLRGAVVTEVLEGGPAARAGIRPDDVVLSIGEKSLDNDCDLVLSAWSLPCHPVRVVVVRAGARLGIDLEPVDEGAFLAQLCGAGNPTACFRQAWLSYSRPADAAEKERALGLLEAACHSGSAEACAYAGHELLGKPDRSAEALSTLTRSCDLGSGSGCAHLAYLYATGTLVGRDDARATALYVRACDRGDGMGCYNVGLMSQHGRGTRVDLARAVTAYEEGCEGGSPDACTNLGYFFEHGEGVPKDPARAVELYRRGCEGSSCRGPNLLGCVNLGRASRDGIGVAKDATRAASIFRDACEEEPSESDVSDAAAQRWRACSLFGALHLSGNGVPKDETAGRELSERGCAGGDAFGCFNAAVVFANGLGVPPDPARAAFFYDAACTAGDGEGCHESGLAYEKGSGVPLDARRAADLFRKACAAGFAPACARKVKR